MTDAFPLGAAEIKLRSRMSRRSLLTGLAAAGAAGTAGLSVSAVIRALRPPLRPYRAIPQSLASLEADPAAVDALAHDLAGRAEFLHDAAPSPGTPSAASTSPLERSPDGAPTRAASEAGGSKAPPMTAPMNAATGRVTPSDLAYLDKHAPKTAMGLAAVRGLWLVNQHTNEEMTALFWNSGAYDNATYTLMCSMMRDWRENETTPMDARLFHLLWAIQRETGFTDPVTITSGFRTVKTNTMLRAEGSAPNSQHMHSRACDIQIAGKAPGSIALAAQQLRIGGVGYYPTFTHVDTGPVRSWRA